jgi:hypothetical protein
MASASANKQFWRGFTEMNKCYLHFECLKLFLLKVKIEKIEGSGTDRV